MKLSTPLRAAVALALAALLGCGAPTEPAPGGDAGPAPEAGRTLCQFVNRLDCDGDPSNGCETRIDEANCGVCGRRCPPNSICTTQGDRCLE